jgi:DNA-binding CsgD family transcriptional regulator
MLVARLTANEKECLRRRLLPQTAKEMALDLGISPHAVEKRLKMARAKLGLSSSLEAARMLAVEEGYQPLVPHSPDLSGLPDPVDNIGVASLPVGGWRRFLLPIGLTMLAALFLLALIQDVPDPSVEPSPLMDQNGREVPGRKVGLNEAAAFNQQEFERKDTDHSGFLDPVEASAMEPRNRYRDASLPAAPRSGTRDPAAEAKWMSTLDHDLDGKVSAKEYVGYMIPWTLWTGVPADAPVSSTR